MCGYLIYDSIVPYRCLNPNWCSGTKLFDSTTGDSPTLNNFSSLNFLRIERRPIRLQGITLLYDFLESRLKIFVDITIPSFLKLLNKTSRDEEITLDFIKKIVFYHGVVWTGLQEMIANFISASSCSARLKLRWFK